MVHVCHHSLFAQNPIIHKILPQFHNPTCCPGCDEKNSLLKLSHILHSMRYASNAFQDRELIESLLMDVMGHSSLAKQEDAHEFFTALTEN